MELTANDYGAISEYLQRTLSPDAGVRRPAEKFLEHLEESPSYALFMFSLVTKEEIDITVRMAGSVAFKNFIKRYWVVEDDASGASADRIRTGDRESIKDLIVPCMLSSPESIQKQLSDAISIIGKHDFPDKWPKLIDIMVEKICTGDFYLTNAVLRLAQSLFKRYTYEFENQTLWTEIKFVLDMFAKPFTELFKLTVALTKAHENNLEALKILYNTLVLASDVFYSLNYQDFPEFFEDNMELWMKNFHALLTIDVPALQSTDEEEAGVIEQLKSQICENVTLYAQKYDEEFQTYLPEFVTAVWNLLTSTGQQTKYDSLVSNALQFLVTVANRSQNRHLFMDPMVLSSICEKAIIPNIEFRESDNELFEDNPEEYIRRDIEGSDVETRRRAACDFVKVLSKYFESRIMEIFGSYIQLMLQNYAEKPAKNWRSKDAAIYLITNSASKGQTEKHGVTKSSNLVPLPQFAAQHIEPQLSKSDVNELPVLKADAIKFIMMFRSVLPIEMVVGSLPQLIRHLTATSIVVHTYAAGTIEKILAMKGADGKSIVKSSDLTPMAPELLKGLFNCLVMPGSEENQYVMKAIMRSFGTLQDSIYPFLADLLPSLTEKLTMVARNPSRPNFNHYLFETLSLCTRVIFKANPEVIASFEQALFPIFQGILQQDVQEFIPYVFQILALFLELRTTQEVPEPYMALFPCLLSPVLFERQENIYSLSKLLRAYTSRCSHLIIAQDKLNALLGVYQKLIASKANDHEGFLLVRSIIEHFNPTVLEPYMKQIFVLLFQRLSSSKTTKYVKGLITFFSYYIIRFNASSLVTIIDQIQPQMFGSVIERVILTDLKYICNEKIIVAIGVSNLLIDCPAILSSPYNTFYPRLLAKLIEYIEEPAPKEINDNNLSQEEWIPDVSVFENGVRLTNQLICARTPVKVPMEVFGDVRLHLAAGLGKLGLLPGLLEQIPEPNANHLRKYLRAAGVAVA